MSGPLRAIWFPETNHCPPKADGKVTETRDESEDLPLIPNVLQPAVNGKLINILSLVLLLSPSCE